MTHNEQLIAWLNDAYGMEMALQKVLQHHIKDAQEIPDIRRRLSDHLEETRRHADRLRGAIEEAGGNISRGKSLIGDIVGWIQAYSTGMYRDEVVKNMLMVYAAEQFEVASYRSLIVAADSVGNTRVMEVCRENLVEDEMMATWIADQIPVVTRMYLARQPALQNV